MSQWTLLDLFGQLLLTYHLLLLGFNEAIDAFLPVRVQVLLLAPLKVEHPIDDKNSFDFVLEYCVVL